MSMRIDIDELILRACRGEASEGELRRLEEWRRSSPENERRFREVSRIVDLAAELEEPLDTTPVSAETVVARAEERRSSTSAARAASSRWSRRRILAGVAAVAAVLVLAFGLDLWWDGTGLLSGPETRVVLETGSEDGRSTQLANGILVYLGPASSLEALETADGPTYRLQGRGFFGVPEQEDGRVVVETAAGRLTVLGTRFGVRSERDDLDLVVVEGRVRVDAPDRDFQLGPAGLGSVRDGRVENVSQADDPLDHLDWMDRAMVFQSTPLRDVAREIERRYGVQIEIRAPGVQDRTVTTAFDGQPFDEVMNIVCRVTDVTCSVTQDAAVIER